MSGGLLQGQRPDRQFLALMACVAGVALGYAIHITDNTFKDAAMPWLIVALVASFAGITVQRHDALERWSAKILPWLAAAALLWEAAVIHNSKQPVRFMTITDFGQVMFFWFVMATLLVTLLAAHGPWRWLGKHHVWMVGIIVLLLAWWIADVSPEPFVDVRLWQNAAAQQLNAGLNPYDNTIPNIYAERHAYGSGMVENGRVLYGYNYLPASFLLGWPGWALGDFRYATGAAWAIAAMGMLALAPSWVATVLAGLFIMTPQGFNVINYFYVEPFLLMLLVLCLLCATRAPRLLPVALGVFAATKQYAPLLTPAAFLLPTMRLSKRAAWDVVWKTAVVALLIVVPFVIWSPSAFWRGAVLSYRAVGFRHDSLNFPAWWAKFNGWGSDVDLFWGYVVAPLAMLWGLVRAPTTGAGVAMTMGFVYLMLVAFGNVAFSNYYWFVLGCFFVAAAATGWREDLAS